MEKPIPAFYCCYLLRSAVKPDGTLYVGSTPNPVRRLRQHNGLAVGGAARTDRASHRPWEMACIVTGFPSRIAALQFEWSWQNTHLTRHIPAEDRITSRCTSKTRKARKKIAYPRFSLVNRISNLHLLLRVRSFERWPLRVTFFVEDIYRIWEKWVKTTPLQLKSNIRVEFEKANVLEQFRRPDADHTTKTPNTIGNGKGIGGIDVSYEDLKPYLEKSRVLREESKTFVCAVCTKHMQKENCIILVCPEEDCKAVSHMTCLSESFLKQEGKPDAVMPMQGRCPSCNKTIQWSMLMKELSLRTRGEKEVASLFKERRRRVTSTSAATAAASAAVELPESEASSDESEYSDIDNAMLPSMTDGDVPQDDSDGFEEVDDWYQRGGSEIDLDIDPTEEESIRTTTWADPTASTMKATRSPIVIEDSDWSDAEDLD